MVRVIDIDFCQKVPNAFTLSQEYSAGLSEWARPDRDDREKTKSKHDMNDRVLCKR